MEKKKNFDAVGWKSYCSRLYGGARHWLGAGWAPWARSMRRRGQAWAQAGVQGAGRAWARGRALQACGRRGQRQAERAAGWASGSSGRQSARQAGLAAAARRVRGRLGERQQGAQGARGAQATGGRRAGRHGVGAQGRAAGRTVRAGHGQPGRGLGAGGWQTGPAGPVLVHCAPGSVLARFLDPVRLGIFLSHQMNIVHYKIKFFRKKNYLIKSNKIK